MNIAKTKRSRTEIAQEGPAGIVISIGAQKKDMRMGLCEVVGEHSFQTEGQIFSGLKSPVTARVASYDKLNGTFFLCFQLNDPRLKGKNHLSPRWVSPEELEELAPHLCIAYTIERPGSVVTVHKKPTDIVAVIQEDDESSPNAPLRAMRNNLAECYRNAFLAYEKKTQAVATDEQDEIVSPEVQQLKANAVNCLVALLGVQELAYPRTFSSEYTAMSEAVSDVGVRPFESVREILAEAHRQMTAKFGADLMQ